MKLRATKKKCIALLITVAEIATSLQLGSLKVSAAEASLTQQEAREIVSTYSVTDEIPGFMEYLNEHSGAAYPKETIEIDASDYISYMEGDREKTQEIYSDYEGMPGDSVLTSENGYIEFEVDVPAEGMYELQVEYYPVEGKNSEIQRSFFIDGELRKRSI